MVRNIFRSEKKRSSLLLRARESGLCIAGRRSLIRHKKSDTLYVLGGGPSINTVNSEGWSEIAKHDSIAINWFFPHPFTPTFHHMELPERADDLFSACLSERAARGEKSTYILNLNNVQDRLWKKLYHQSPFLYSIPSQFKEVTALRELRQCIQYFGELKLIERGWFLHIRGSLTVAISLGVMLGYRKIILCGFDMDSMEYFFDDRKLYNSEIAQRLRHFKEKTREKKVASGDQNPEQHRTIARNWTDQAPLDEVVLVFNEELLQPRGISLFLYNKRSLLYPSIPVYHHKG